MFNENNTTRLGVRQQRSHSPPLISTDTLKEFWVRFAPHNSITYMQMGANYHKWLPTAWRGKRGEIQLWGAPGAPDCWQTPRSPIFPICFSHLLPSAKNCDVCHPKSIRGTHGARKTWLKRCPGQRDLGRCCNGGHTEWKGRTVFANWTFQLCQSIWGAVKRLRRKCSDSVIKQQKLKGCSGLMNGTAPFLYNNRGAALHLLH